MTYGLLIRNIREKHGFSQSEIASKLGIHRSSYIDVEKGKRELSLSEASKLSDILGISIKEIDSQTLVDYEKYKQMILLYLRKYKEITKTKLAKLLYLADFAWFYNHLESMSGMPYRRIQYGPVPDLYFRAIDDLFENGLININPKNDALIISETRSGSKLKLPDISKQEQAMISKIAKKWEKSSTKEIVSFTHNQLPYTICSENEIIPYELITQENPSDVY